MNDLARKALSVDFSELCLALTAEGELRWYLDLLTGDVILVNGEYDPLENGGVSLEDLATNTRRFVAVPPADPQTVVADMRAWLGQLTDGRLKESLDLALAAPRPERRFKAALTWLPAMLDEWHRFRAERCEGRAKAWLASMGIEPTPRPPEQAEG